MAEVKQCQMMNIFKKQCLRHKGHKGFHYYEKNLDYEQSRGAKSSEHGVLTRPISHPLVSNPTASPSLQDVWDGMHTEPTMTLPSTLDEIPTKRSIVHDLVSEPARHYVMEEIDKKDVQEMVIREIIFFRKSHTQDTVIEYLKHRFSVTEEMIEDYKRRQK